MPAFRRYAGCLITALALTIGVLVPSGPLRGATPRFYADDPLMREPETQDASRVQRTKVELGAELLLNLFARPGDPATGVRARNVNTIDEVPDSSWFTNRIYHREITADEIVRGPNASRGPAIGKWTVVATKTSGVAPGFTMRDSAGETWFVQFDSAGHPRAATAAVAVAVRLFWALGYNQIETHLVRVRPADIVIGSDATVETRAGHHRPFRRADLERVLSRAAADADGSYRAAAGRAVPGRVVGPFRYYGTRADDPNDVVPHEHRRELRALRVFGAWTNLVDMKAGNTLDTVVEENGRSVVRHYLQDVGSTFGTGALGPREWDEGYEYLYEGAPLLKRLATLGFYLRPWQSIPYDERQEVGRFEGDEFDPRQWRPRMPTAAFLRADATDDFWAALRVRAFSDALIYAAVHEGQFSDSPAERQLAAALIKRRDAIARAYLPAVTPLMRFALDDADRLTFVNAAAEAGVSRPAFGYVARWFRYDNATDASQEIGISSGTSTSLAAPEALAHDDGTFVKIAIDIDRHDNPLGAVEVYFRRQGAAWRLVGVERARP
jgi:hypothetical protein